MRLRLSSLVGIIAIIYFCFYYMVYSPCAIRTYEIPEPVVLVPEQPGYTDLEMFTMEPSTELNLNDDAVDYTPLENNSVAGVPVEAGNVRPDNVMIWD